MIRYVMPGVIIHRPGNILSQFAQQGQRNGLAMSSMVKCICLKSGRLHLRCGMKYRFIFPFTGLDTFVVIPNHIHGIIIINRSVEKPIVEALHATPLQPPDAKFLKNETMSSISPKPGSLSVVERSYK